MKKNLIICILICNIITGCFNNKNIKEENKNEIITICRSEQDIKDDAKASLKYEIHSTNDTVSKLISTEIIETDDKEYLKETKSNIEKTYSIYKNIKHYQYSIKIKDNVLTSTVNIDYSKINIDKLISIDRANENLILDGKVSLNYLKNMYESLGNICIEKE